MDPYAVDILRRAYAIRVAARSRGDDDVEDLAELVEDLAHLHARGHDPPRIVRARGRFRGAIAGILATLLRAIE